MSMGDAETIPLPIDNVPLLISFQLPLALLIIHQSTLSPCISSIVACNVGFNSTPVEPFVGCSFVIVGGVFVSVVNW